MTGTKTCTKCLTAKDKRMFFKRKASKDGLSTWCKDCYKQYGSSYYASHREQYKEKRAKYYSEHKEQYAERGRKYFEEHKEELYESRHEAYLRNPYIYRKYANEWRRKNKDKVAEYTRNRRKTDKIFKLKTQIRKDIQMSFKRCGYSKSKNTESIVGCDINHLITHLELTWERRYGREYTGEPCHIDHIVPLATADTYEEVVKLCHYMNLQLLTPEDNLSKSDKLQNRPT